MASLPPGTRVGSYEVTGSIGAGGMGEVFRARDLSLRRDAALKILPERLVADEQHRARFAREARTLAALNHPNIAQVYGLEESPAGPAIAMEFVAGSTLTDKIRGGVSRQDVWVFARQIAAALDAAHEKGIVHRDLKPGNIMVTPEGVAKVLDFGIATTGLASPIRDATTVAATKVGAVVGTPAYMSPEQARGMTVDRRTDIWAFGCVLYELLAGRRPFEGATSSDLIAAVIEREPDWRGLPADTPPRIRQLIERCLQKDPRQRLRDIGDALPDLAAPEAQRAPAVSSSSRTRVVALAAGAFVVGVAATWVLLTGRSTASPSAATTVVRLALPPPPGVFFRGPAPDLEATTVAVSPDGGTVAFVGTRSGEAPRVWLRPLAEEPARELSGTDGAVSVFWAPDGRSIGFFAGGQLKRTAVAGGAPTKICDVEVDTGLSGSWGTTGEILFATVQGQRIWRVPASGGAPVEVVATAGGPGAQRVLWPRHLPDGRRFVYTMLTSDYGGQVMLVDADGTRTSLLDAASQVQWVEPNWLIYVREGTLLAQRVDVDTRRALGEPVSIVGPIPYSAATGWANFAASPNGTIIVQSQGNEQRLAWFDRAGEETGRVSGSGDYNSLRLSPDNATLLFERLRRELGTYDVWAADLGRSAETRVTSSPGMETYATWIPGRRVILYAAATGGAPNIFEKDLDTGAERRLLTASRFHFPSDVTPDGQQLVYQQRTELGNWDVMIVPLADPTRAAPLLASSFSETQARIAPDGKRIAFTSDESGRAEVYVTSFPAVGVKQAVSTAGGFRVRWRSDGREVFFISGSGQLMAASIDAAGTPGAPRPLFNAATWGEYDVARDGRFIAVVSETIASRQPLTVIVNWPHSISPP